MGSEGSLFGDESPGAQGLIEPGDQTEEPLTWNRGPRPQDPGAREVAEAVDAQGHRRQSRHRLGGPLDTSEGLGAEGAEEAQGEVQILRMGAAGAPGQESPAALDQSGADLRVRPQGEEPALGAGVQPRCSSSSSKARRTAWWRTSSRLPAN